MKIAWAAIIFPQRNADFVTNNADEVFNRYADDWLPAKETKSITAGAYWHNLYVFLYSLYFSAGAAKFLNLIENPS